jgi:aspartate carbamoyltransferase catalytic subunit
MVYTYDEQIVLPMREKLKYLSQNDKVFHIIFAEQFDRQALDFICRIATILRKIGGSRAGRDYLRTLLSHKSAMLYFTQPSTRTFLSFVRACQFLGINYAEVRDPNISSFYKGETETDGIRTFSNYFDLIIMRHHEGGLAERVAYMMSEIGSKIPVINGGAGPDEHPTQALLDIYTLQRSFEKRSKGMDGIHVGFLGDVARGRTVRSLARLLIHYDAKITFIAPSELAIKDDLRTWLERNQADYYETTKLSDVIDDLDAVYVTRIQDEYGSEGDAIDIDYSPYYLTPADVDKMKQDAVIMHPLPRRGELAPEIDFNHRARYWEQEINGMWARAALVAYLFNVESHILDYYSRHHSSGSGENK